MPATKQTATEIRRERIGSIGPIRSERLTANNFIHPKVRWLVSASRGGPWVSFLRKRMEIETSETEGRIAGNIAVLAGVEAEIVSLEEAFAGLESLKTERDRLTAAVRTSKEEETRTQ